MLDSIRAAADTVVAKIFLGVLLLCFILLWGIPELNRARTNDVLISGGSSINTELFSFALNDQIMRISAASGLQRSLTLDEAKRYDVLDPIMQEISQNLLLSEEARRMKIGVSADGIAAAIGKDRLFFRDGKFDAAFFKSYLAQARVKSSNITDYYGEREKSAQIIDAVSAGLQTPRAYLNALNIYDNETRDVDYITINSSIFGPIVTPSEDELTKWFAAHKNNFKAPEYRQFAYMRLSGEDLAKSISITDEAIEGYYKDHAERFMQPERRSVDILHFATRKEAEDAETSIKSGKSFDDLITEQKKTVNDVRQQLIEKSKLSLPIASDVFALKKNEVSSVINDLNGPIIARVVDIVPSQPKPLADVKEEIKQLLTRSQSSEEMVSDRENIEKARNEGTKLSDLAKQFNLAYKEITVDSKGETEEGKVLNDLPQQEALLKAVNQAVVGMDHDPITLKGGGYVWYDVEKIIPARERNLDEVREQAVAGWKADELQKMLDAKTNEVMNALNTQSLADIAANLRVTVQSEVNIKRKDTPKSIGANAVRNIFATAANHYGQAKGVDEQTRIIFKVKNITDPDVVIAQPSEEILRTTADSFRADIITGVLQAANSAHPVKYNKENLKRVTNGAL